jgi:hypothetical protein
MTNPNHRLSYFLTTIVFNDVVVRNYLVCGPDKKSANIAAPFVFDETQSAIPTPSCLFEANFKHKKIKPTNANGIVEISKEQFDEFSSNKKDYYVVHDTTTPALRESNTTPPNPKPHPDMKPGDLWIGLCYMERGETLYFQRGYRGCE